MSEVIENVKRWCAEESIELRVLEEKPDCFSAESALDWRPEPLEIASSRGRISLRHTFSLDLAESLRADPEIARQVAEMLASISASRSFLTDCRALFNGSPRAEITTISFEDGLTKQVFLTAIAEARKVRLLIESALQAAAAGVEAVAGMRAAIVEAETLVGGMATDLAAADVPPAALAPSPAPPQPPIAAPAGGFCPHCGSGIPANARFCRHCGGSREG
jgi:hypothetical protein